jgi:hypothetical protein
MQTIKINTLSILHIYIWDLSNIRYRKLNPTIATTLFFIQLEIKNINTIQPELKSN